MARKTKAAVITAEGRDKGKTFWLTEMAAVPAEEWATRALLAIGRGGRHELPEDVAQSGAVGLIQLGLRALTSMDFADAKPLMAEMLECVQFVPDPSKTDQFTKQPITRPVLWDTDVEEVATLLMLRSEVIELHLGFSIAAFLSTLGERAKATLSSPDTPTSLKASETSSAPA